MSSKKRKFEASSVLNSAQLKIDDGKLSTADTIDTIDTKEESGTWFWNKSANKSDSDTKNEGNKREGEDEDSESNSHIEKPRTKRVVSPEVKIK